MIEMNFTPFPILTTDRLVLRQLDASDAQDIFVHRGDDIVNTYVDDFRHSSIEQTSAFIERVQNEIAFGKTILWVITERGNNTFIGTICFWNISRDEHRAETGYTLAPQFHGKGYMNEALAKVINFGFNTMKLKTIDAYTHEKNEGSIKLLLRNNFKRGKTAKKEVVGENRVYFELIPHSFSSLH